MSRRRKTARPADPVDIARRRAEAQARERDPAQWGLNGPALALPANADLAVGGNSAGKVARARRQDVFEMMGARGRLNAKALEAVRRLQEDIARLHETAVGGVRYEPRVDRSIAPQGYSDARLKAGARIERVMRLAGPASARLLAALCEPALVMGRVEDWREVVRRETGEGLADAQGALLRMACENLAGAYEIVDRSRSTGATQAGSRDLSGCEADT